MADFDQAIPVILRHEGSEYTNYPNDYGGPTKYGITLREYRRVMPGATEEDIRKLDEVEARWFYQTFYWNEFMLEEVKDQQVATKMFDLFVNMSPRSAATVVQRSLWRVNKGVNVDGIMGPRTLRAVNSCDPSNLITALVEEQKKFYRERVVQDPTQAKWLKGWLARADWPFKHNNKEIV